MHKAMSSEGAGYEINTLLLIPVKAFEVLVAYPTRLGIMNTLVNGPSTVTDISCKLGIAKGIVHRHLKVLEKLGWVKVADDYIVELLKLPKEANRIYYMLTSLIYLGYNITVNDDVVNIRVDGGYVAFPDSRKGTFIVKTPSGTYGCVKSCSNSSECINWAIKASRRFKVQLSTASNVDDLLGRLFYEFLVKNLSSPKAKLPLIRITDLKIDNMYRQWLGSPIKVNFKGIRITYSHSN